MTYKTNKLNVLGTDGQYHEVVAIKGKDGKTPAKGVDYFTPAEQEAIKNDVEQAIDITTVKQDIQNLENDKANYVLKVIASDEVTQLDATEVLSDVGTYDGKLIEFLTNGENPSKCVATGRLMTASTGDTYLIVYGKDGMTAVWTKDGFSKPVIESRNLINEMTDIDNLTIDVAGNPPCMYSVRNAFNDPPEVSADGIVFVLPHAIDRQIQYYIDMQTAKKWHRTVTGLAGRHSFGTWTQDAVPTASDITATVPQGLTAEPNVQSILYAIWDRIRGS